MADFFDLGLIRGLITAVLLFAFCGMVIWAFSRNRSSEFERASAMPLDDDLDQPLPLTDWENEGNPQ